MNWKFWKKRTPPPQPEAAPVDNNAYLTIGLTPEGGIQQYAYFPEYPNEFCDQAGDNFALLLNLLSTGKLNALLQKAIVVGGQRSANATNVSNRALKKFYELTMHTAMEDDLSELVVPPRKVFNYNGDDRND